MPLPSAERLHHMGLIERSKRHGTSSADRGAAGDGRGGDLPVPDPHVLKDLRDPKLLGAKLLEVHSWDKGVPLHQTASFAGGWKIPDYDANPGPIEKYGDPTKLPSTMP